MAKSKENPINTTVLTGNKNKCVMTVEGSDITTSTEVVYILTITENYADYPHTVTTTEPGRQASMGNLPVPYFITKVGALAMTLVISCSPSNNLTWRESARCDTPGWVAHGNCALVLVR